MSKLCTRWKGTRNPLAPLSSVALRFWRVKGKRASTTCIVFQTELKSSNTHHIEALDERMGRMWRARANSSQNVRDSETQSQLRISIKTSPSSILSGRLLWLALAKPLVGLFVGTNISVDVDVVCCVSPFRNPSSGESLERPETSSSRSRWAVDWALKMRLKKFPAPIQLLRWIFQSLKSLTRQILSCHADPHRASKSA